MKPGERFPRTGPWWPRFWDYLYLSLTNSTAVSPTDALALPVRAKLIMGAQSVVSLATVATAIVRSRAVNILNWRRSLSAVIPSETMEAVAIRNRCAKNAPNECDPCLRWVTNSGPA